jgi:Animal haem peroxidase
MDVDALCSLNISFQLNSVTHFLDMDFLYVPETVQMAIKNGGKFNEDEASMHRIVILGDERSRMFSQFFSLVVVWVKFHNIIVNELTRLYPELPVDVKFYEARRFLISVYQNILYSEVLPVIVSPKVLAKYHLLSQRPCYDPTIDPSVTVEFAASAGRFMHTFIHNNYTVNFKNGTSRDILLRHLDDESLGFTELTGVITGLLGRPWNHFDIAHEVDSQNIRSEIMGLTRFFPLNSPQTICSPAMARRDLTCAHWTCKRSVISELELTAMLCITSISPRAVASKSFPISSRSSQTA